MPIGDQQRQPRRRLLRHRIHMYAYGLISFSLMSMGLVFSGFAIFKRDSEISKIWLAGPTTIAVGLVLCGKVIIDCRPRHPIVDDDATNEEEIADIAPKMALSKKGKRSEMNRVKHLINDGVIKENYTPAKRNSLPNCHHSLIKAPPREDSEIWNLRDDTGTKLLSGRDTGRDLLCLPNSGGLADRCARGNGSHCLYSCRSDSELMPNSMQLAGQCSPVGDPRLCACDSKRLSAKSFQRLIQDDEERENSNLLYQGELFLLNDRQYFI